ncbi:MAG: diguanylate cyclase [Pseudomonadota bacterium]
MENIKKGERLYFSIPIKVIIFSGLVYLITWLMGFAMREFGGLNFNLTIFGIKLEHIYILLQVMLISLTATITTYIFLDRPLNLLREAFTRVENGDFLIRVPVISNDELGLVTDSFNKMLSHITDLSVNKIEAQQELELAQQDQQLKRKLEKKTYDMERFNRELESAVKDLSMIYEIGQEVSTMVDLETLYKSITETLKKFLHINQFAIMEYDSKEGKLFVKSAYGFQNDDQFLQNTYRRGEGIFGLAVEERKTFYSKDSVNDSRFYSFYGSRFEVSQSFVSIPLIYKGAALGVVNFGRIGVDSFSESDLKMLELVTGQIALALANAKLYTQTRELSFTDELTNVYNRRHFHHMLQIEWKRAVRFQRDLSGIMIDVDYFKKFNDTFGHPKGDQVLREIGALLKANLREVDTVSRFGGEEFFLLLPDTDKHGALAVAEKVRKLVEEGNIGGGREKGLNVTISAGISSYPDNVEELEELIDNADIALYRAKEAGRNRVFAYEHEENTEVTNNSIEPFAEEVTQEIENKRA